MNYCYKVQNKDVLLIIKATINIIIHISTWQESRTISKETK